MIVEHLSLAPSFFRLLFDPFLKIFLLDAGGELALGETPHSQLDGTSVVRYLPLPRLVPGRSTPTAASNRHRDSKSA